MAVWKPPPNHHYFDGQWREYEQFQRGLIAARDSDKSAPRPSARTQSVLGGLVVFGFFALIVAAVILKAAGIT